MRQQNVTDDSLIWTVAEVNEQERGLERSDWSKYSGVRIGIQCTKTFSVNRSGTMLNVCEGLVLALGRFFSYEAGVFFMLTWKVIRYSVQKALKLVLILVFSRHSIILIAAEIFFSVKILIWVKGVWVARTLLLRQLTWELSNTSQKAQENGQR